MSTKYKYSFLASWPNYKYPMYFSKVPYLLQISNSLFLIPGRIWILNLYNVNLWWPPIPHRFGWLLTLTHKNVPLYIGQKKTYEFEIQCLLFEYLNIKIYSCHNGQYCLNQITQLVVSGAKSLAYLRATH